jgi:hypothetical protein
LSKFAVRNAISKGVLSSSCPADSQATCTSRTPSAFDAFAGVAKVLRLLLKPVEASTPQRTQYLDVTFQKYGSHVHQLQPS